MPPTGTPKVPPQDPVKGAAFRFRSAGLSFVPIKTDGSKAPPPVPWKVYETRRPSEYEIGQLFRGGVGIAIIGGRVSGGLEIVDIDAPGLVEAWTALVEAARPGLMARLPMIRTPKGGAHVYYRCAEIEGNQKLAMEPFVNDEGKPAQRVLLETRGEGGYCFTKGHKVVVRRKRKESKFNRLVDISEVQVGDILISYDETRGSVSETTVQQTSHRAVPETYIVKFGLRKGILRLTGEHPLFATEGWKPTKELGIGDELLHFSRDTLGLPPLSGMAAKGAKQPRKGGKSKSTYRQRWPSHRKCGMTRFERFILSVARDIRVPLKFVGDGSFCVTQDGFTIQPDFIIEGTKKLVEVSIDWRKKGLNGAPKTTLRTMPMEDRLNLLRKAGFSVIHFDATSWVIDENTVAMINEVRKQLLEFSGNGVSIDFVHRIWEDVTVYNVHCEPHKNYFVRRIDQSGDDFILAHNCIAPPSPPECHPTGRSYEHAGGPPLTEIPTITPEERGTLLDAARSFNKAPKETRSGPPPRPRATGETGPRPGDDFNARASWQEILTPHGWTALRESGPTVFWRRPGKTDPGCSATTGHCGDNFYVFSSNAHPFEAETAYTKFATFTILEHGGDYGRAAQALAERGYGAGAADPAEMARREREIGEFKSVGEIRFVSPAPVGSEEPAAAPAVGGEAASAAPPAGGETATASPPKKYKKRDERHAGNAARYFEGKEFLPARLVKEILGEHRLIASPVSRHEGMGMTLFLYEDGHFSDSGAAIIRTQIDAMLGEESKESRIRSVVDLLRERCKRDYRAINRKSCDLINVENGMLDWKSGELLPHDPSYYSTIRINAKWDPSSGSPIVDKFLTDVFPPDALTLAEEIMGYLLVPSTKFQKSFVLVGEGSNGKTRFFDLIRSLLGEANVSNVSLHDVEEGRFCKAELFGKLVNIDSETADRMMKSTSQFKAIVGGDRIMGEQKGKDPFYFVPFARLLFAANRFPRSHDTTRAYFRRLVFVPFEREFKEGQADLDIGDKLSTPEARARSLVRAVAGLRRLSERGAFTVPDSSNTVMEEYRKECNSAYDFAQSFCAPADDSWIKKSEIYKTYKEWCSSGNMKPFSEREFNKILVQSLRFAEGRQRTESGFVRVWKGIRWNDRAEEELKEVQREIEGFGSIPKPEHWTDF